MSSGSLFQESRHQDITSVVKVTDCSPGGARANVVQEIQEINVASWGSINIVLMRCNSTI